MEQLDFTNDGYDYLKQNEKLKIREELFHLFKISSDAKSMISKYDKFIVKIPEELAMKMKVHDVQFLRDKAGDLLPTLYDYTDNGFAGHIRLELKDSVNPESINNFTNSIQNMIELERFHSLSEKIQQVQVIVERIEEGQENDRIAKVIAGQKLLNMIEHNPIKPEQKDEIKRAVILIYEGVEQIRLNIESKIEAFPELPDGLLGRVFYILKNANNRDEVRKTHQSLQKSFYYYCQGVSSMLYAYSLLNESNKREIILEDSFDFLNHPNIKRLEKVDLILFDQVNETNWYNRPQLFKEELLQDNSHESKQDTIEYIFTGEELLKIMEYEGE